MFKLFKSKTIFRIPLAIIVAIAIVLAGGAIVWGVIVSDTFTTTDDVAATWRTTVSTSTGEVMLEAQSCDNSVWFCMDSAVCTNYEGDGNGLLVYRTDVSGTKAWKNANTACDPPQCSTAGGQDGDRLVADNTVTFSTTYPAREACKALGGRLPTKDELSCMYTNRATFGNNFQSNYYWSSAEYTTSYAWSIYFSFGSATYDDKTSTLYVRCVRGWSN